MSRENPASEDPSSLLARPLKLPCGVLLPNRMGKSAMTEGLAGVEGMANDRHAALYRLWSKGGAGLLITGNVMVDWRYLERPGNVVADAATLALDGAMPALERWVEAGTAHGNHLWAQINHAGRQCSRVTHGRPVAPSAVQLKLAGFFARPRALEDSEIREIVASFAAAASALKTAGFTGIQIHGAHGYLVSQFLSPRTNRRTDRWGGSLENRARFLLEVVRAVRAAIGPDLPLSVKLNSADFLRGGFELEEAARVAAWLAEEGIDLLEISGGTYERLRFLEQQDEVSDDGSDDGALAEGSRIREAFFLDYAQTIRAEIGALPLMVTGGFRTRAAMIRALEDERLEMVGLARPLCVHPDIPQRLSSGELEAAPAWEKDLRLAGGRLGPTSPWAAVRGFGHQASVAWFYRQILDLADGREPNTGLSARAALFRHLRDEIRLGLARRRYRRP